MNPPNAFAHVSATPEAIVLQICHQLRADVPAGVDGQGIPLERLAQQAVQALWPRPVKAFIPALALREVREHLREQGLPAPALPSEAAPVRPRPRRVRDAMSVAGDVQSVADDVLHLDERETVYL